MRTRMSTLCYIEKNHQYLMLHRVSKKNDVNKDKWIGVGGHFEDGESPEECVLRETKEETGYTLTSYRYRGLVTFVFADLETEYMSLFTADGFEGEEIPCNEGVLEWVNIQDVWKLNLWEGDKIFFRLLEENIPFFSLKLVYDIDGNLEAAVLNGKPMEMFDIIDEQGKKTGKIKERGLSIGKELFTPLPISGLQGQMKRAATTFCCKNAVPARIPIRGAMIFPQRDMSLQETKSSFPQFVN